MRGRSNGAIEYGSLPAAAGDSSVTGCELGVEEGRRPVGRVAPRPPHVRSAMALIILLVACSNLRSRSETTYRLSVSQLTSLHADQVISLIHLLLNPIHNLFFSQCRAKFGDHLPSRGSKLLSNAYMACSAATTLRRELPIPSSV